MHRIVALLAALGSLACTSAAAAPAPLVGTTFVVDPGHGTRYPSGAPLNVGAVGPDGIQEAHVTLAIGNDLATLLRAQGARVVMTRTTQTPYRTGTNKSADNRARAALANKLDATAFVALHGDSSYDVHAHGTSIFWLRPNSVALAVAIRKALRPLGLGESQYRPRHLAVTDEAVVPAVLVELGFVSNPRQERLLADPAFQHREAKALFDAIVGTYGQ